MIDHKGGSRLCRNLEALNPGSTKPIFWKFVRNCLYNVYLGSSWRIVNPNFNILQQKNVVTQEITSYVQKKIVFWMLYLQIS